MSAYQEEFDSDMSSSQSWSQGVLELEFDSTDMSSEQESLFNEQVQVVFNDCKTGLISGNGGSLDSLILELRGTKQS